MERTKARTQHLDNKILFKIQELHGPRLDKAMTFFTLMGNGALIWVFTGIFITLFTQYKYHGVLLIVTISRSGTGCVSEINDHLFEGRYSPKWPDGKKHARNVYAHTREECEEKLKVLIVEMKAGS